MRKLTRRSYNRKLIVFGLAIFLSFGMISTGFAAWLISSATEKEANSPITVDKIVDESFELTIEQLAADGTTWNGKTLSFDAVKGDTTGRIQHQAESNEDAGEALTIDLSGTVTNIGALGTQPDTTTKAIKVEITLPETLVAAINANYLTASYTVGTDTNAIDVAGKTGDQTIAVWIAPTADATEANNGTYALTLTFAWGSAFRGENPSVYYDTDYAESTTETPLGKAISDAQMKEELAAFRATLIDANAGDTDVFEKAYSGNINFAVHAAASY